MYINCPVLLLTPLVEDIMSATMNQNNLQPNPAVVPVSLLGPAQPGAIRREYLDLLVSASVGFIPATKSSWEWLLLLKKRLPFVEFSPRQYSRSLRYNPLPTTVEMLGGSEFLATTQS